jgi:L-threonylcarbamoyladenylate synthase
MDVKIAIDQAVKVLKEGGVILYPTDTVWGLGCDATNPEAVEKIYKIKKRSDNKSLITLVEDEDMLCRYIKEIPQIALQLIELSDKPLTIVYPGAIGIARNVVSEDNTIGIRIPDHEFCRQLLHRFRKPIVSTSANISGEKAPSFYMDICDEIKKEVDWVADPVFEADSTGKPSSIIKLGLGGEVEIIRK